MNLEGQNLESLRRMVRHLQEENQELKELLKKYQSLSKIKNESPENLSKIIPMDAAINLLEFLNKEEDK